MGSTCSAESARENQELVTNEKSRCSLQNASAQLGARLEDLEQKISQADEEAKQWVAKQATYPAAKSRAMIALKRKKMLEQQRDQLMGTQFNVETLAFQQSQASVTLSAVSAIQEAATTLKKQTDSIGVNEVEQLRDNLEYLQADMQDIQAALSMPVGGVDELEAEQELQSLYAQRADEEADIVSQILAGNGAVSGTKISQSAKQHAKPAETRVPQTRDWAAILGATTPESAAAALARSARIPA